MAKKIPTLVIQFDTEEDMVKFAKTISYNTLSVYQGDTCDPEFSGNVPPKTYVLREKNCPTKSPAMLVG